MQSLLSKLVQDYPQFNFASNDTFYWSPKNMQINYSSQLINTHKGKWTLLHELGHALSGHRDYVFDLELIEIELSAWKKAKEISQKYNVMISSDHIEDCLDTYRDWLHQRSKCPTCDCSNIQENSMEYHCYNCNHRWTVTQSRLCRPYRLSSKKETTPNFKNQTLLA